MSGREYSVEWLSQVVARHAPIFHLHQADAFMPCSVEHFMAHSRLVLAGPGRGKGTPSPSSSAGAELLPRGFVTAETLLEQQLRYPPPAMLVLELDPAGRAGAPKDQIDSVPLYAHAKEILAPPSGPEATQGLPAAEALEINYLTFYAYNGHYNVGGVRLVKTGAHDGDWEHITARVHPRSGELLGMWYNAHRSRDGMWVEAGRVPRTPEGRPVAYVALHGHGVYPMPGTIPRHFFLGNDKCSGKGPTWSPHTVVLLPPLHEDPTATPAVHAVHAVRTAPQHQGSMRLDSAPAAPPGEQGAWLSDSAGGLGGEGKGVEQQQGGPAAEGLAGQLAAVQLSTTSAQHAEQERSRCLQGAAATEQPRNSGADPAAAAAAAAVQGMPPTAPPPIGPPRVRCLHAAHSRGSSLGGDSSGGNGNSNGSNGSADVKSASWACTERGVESGGGDGGVRVIVDDPCHWLFFRGLWGQTDAPIIQPWFSTAEPPISRTALLRLFAHFWPEKNTL